MSENVIHKKAIVLGAGVSGLCCTHRLMEQHGAEEVVCLEKASRAGGYIQSENIEGYICDEGPNGFLDKEPRMLEWIESLGISDELIRANEASAHRFLLLNGLLQEIQPPPAFLKTPVLSLKGRMRLLKEPLIRKRTDEAPESIWDFAARRIGPEAADTLVSAMVLGVYGGDAKKLSLTHCFPRMAEMEREYGSLMKAMKAKAKEVGNGGGPAGPGGTLTTFKTGIGRLTERAAEVVAPCLQLDTTVKSISKNPDGAFLVETNSQHFTTDSLVCALPAHASVDLFNEFAPDLSEAVATIRNEPIAVICTGHDKKLVGHDLEGFGYLVPPNQNRDVLGCIWTSSLYDDFAPDGKVYLRTMIGGAIHPEYVDQSDEELMKIMRKEVLFTLGILTDSEFVKIYRHPRGIPQYGLNHGEVLRAIATAEAEHPGLCFTGNSYHGISMNDCVKHAFDVTDKSKASV